MLARLEPELPLGEEWSYEPKWDGFRCLLFRDGDTVDLRSRNDRPLARYFPEVVSAARSAPQGRFVLDGELLVHVDGRADFPALLARLHPAESRANVLAERTPATYVAFDLLAAGDDVLLGEPLHARRTALGDVGAVAGSRMQLTPCTHDPAVARDWLDAARGSGIDGVVAKRAASPYEPGRRAMVKIKRRRTVDCVVAGLRLHRSADELGSLLLGLYDDAGALHHVGVVTGFPRPQRAPLLDRLRPLVTALEGHPWQQGFGLEGGALGRLKGTAGRWTPDLPRDWVPLRPQLVCEVGYDAAEGTRFRHPARLLRWRPDRDARTCLLGQLAAGR